MVGLKVFEQRVLQWAELGGRLLLTLLESQKRIVEVARG